MTNNQRETTLQELAELLPTLTDSEVIYTVTLLKQLFSGRNA